MVVPCKNCQNREIGCHGKCENYKNYQKEVEKVRKKRKNDQLFGISYRKYRDLWDRYNGKPKKEP